ncbi:MAG: triphosphoribosyl-dephospho-CoA synthase MdcB [Verrucomicrobia bacterium]|nr:triphosphoribosyl-dephospho-CoA synthase MdcB [Verrucomicrobiota bacterium]
MRNALEASPGRTTEQSSESIADLAVTALSLEIATRPKPGLVSPRDPGSHADMDADTMRAGAESLRPCFASLAEAGAAQIEWEAMRAIGRAGEQAMLSATGGINTHRGVIFGLGLLCAAAGARPAQNLGAWVRQQWGDEILGGASERGESHGARARRRYGAGGARAEAAAGFPHVYRVGLPAFLAGRRKANCDENAARVQACFALIAELADTNLLHRGGAAGLRFAQRSARDFLAHGGVGQRDWQMQAEKIHRQFVARWLSPGGSADLLAMTLFVHALEAPAAVPEKSVASAALLATA